MKAFFKTLFGDTWNIAGVSLIVAIGAVLTSLGHANWAVFAVPIAGLGVVALLARH